MIDALLMTALLALPATDRAVRPSQFGYEALDPKVARVLARSNLTGAAVEIRREEDGTTAWSGTLAGTAGSWGNFAFVHPIDFSGFTTPGLYSLRLPATGETSSPFEIGGLPYESLGASLTAFFRVQRCGDTTPALHGPCHLLDAHHIVGGPDDGDPVNVAGGWHDAGDYIKFLTTEAVTLELLLWAEEVHPFLAGDQNGNGRSDGLDEAAIGARHLLALRYQPGRFLYQIQDSADHGQGWRMPEDDDLAPIRPAFYGAGKNHLGRYAAALARAARAFLPVEPGLADSCLAAAVDAYTSASSAPSIVNGEFYQDSTWQDMMGLGAMELFLTTGEGSYLAAAKSYADLAGPGYWVSWGTLNGFLNALLAPYHPPALANLEVDLDTFREEALAHPFAMAGTEVWGVSMVLAGAASLALLHERVTGSATYLPLATAQRDFLLGANPWGVCLVGAWGTTSPHDFHHQVAFLSNGGALPGCLTEGPAPLSDFQAMGITLAEMDEFAEFQASRGVYHDDRNDYVTNEPTIVQNAMMVLMTALFASRAIGPASASLEDPRLPRVIVWPNPATHRLTIRAPGPESAVQLIDVSGRRVAAFPGGRVELSLGLSVPAGTYWLVSPGYSPARLTITR